MADSSEVEKLKARIEELEQQLSEERDEFEWDLKAAKESSDQTVRKLEEEIERLRQAGGGAARSTAPSAEPGKPGDTKLLTQRALMAERRVAELQEELKRASQLTPAPAPKEDPLLRQRAEAAERERENLRKEKRALERSLEEKKSSIDRLKKEQEENRGLKRQLESAKKDLADREKELRKARDAVSGQGDLSSELEQREAKIQELAQELNNLAAVEVERDSLVKEMEQLRAGMQKRQSDQSEQEAAQIAGLEAEVERLKQELAQVQLASGQMVEQRERETARLKADLQEVSQKEATFAGKTDQMKREVTRLRDELAVTTRERDELVAQLRAMREDQETGVYMVPGDGKQQADLFAEDTQLTAQPRGSEEGVQTETSRDGTPLGAGRPPPPVEEAEDLFPEDGFVQDEVTQKAKPSFAKGETRRAEVPPAPTEGSPSEDELAPPAVESVPLAKMEVEESAHDLMVPTEGGAPEQTQNVRTDRRVPRPPPQSLRVARPMSKKGVWVKVVIFGVLAGVLIVGAYYFFPKWFGLGGEGGEPVAIEATDSGEPADAGAAEEVVAADAGEETADAPAVEEADAGEELEEPVEPKEVSPKIRKAHEFAARLLKRRRFNKAVNFLEGWVRKEPADPTFRLLYGRAKFGKRWYKSAAEELEKAIELDPGMAAAYYELGGVYIRMKDNDKACRALKKYIELRPSHPRTPKVKKNIRKLDCPE
jgi:hypothetical protein